ncbi:hypothetical protein RhiirB3_453592, partial [Rhizophagus irregularis]
VSVPFTLNWYRHLSFWIDIGALYFGLVLAFFTLDCIGETLHISETLYFRSVSAKSFTLDPYRLRPLDTRYQLASVGTFG